MLQGINSAKAARSIRLQQLRDEVLGLLGDATPDLALELPYTAFHLLNDLFLGTGIERWATAKHDVENDTDAPQITLLVVVAAEDFRGDVVRGTIHLAHLVRRLLRAIVMRGTKVDYLNAAAVLDIDQYVLRLQVTMCNVLTVTVCDCLQQLLEDDSRLNLAEVVTLRDLVEQLASLA